MTISATSPADLLLVADAFTDAARRLSDELDKVTSNAEQVSA